MAKLDDLLYAGKEMDALMGMDPEFDVTCDEVQAIAWIKKAIPKIAATDRFTPETQAVIDEITEQFVSETEKTEKVESAIDLKTEIENSKNRLRDLKDIATEYDEFKSIRGMLSSFKTPDELKAKMLEMIKYPLTTAKVEETKGKGKGKKKEKVTETPDMEPKNIMTSAEPKDTAKSTPTTKKETGKTKFGHQIASQAGVIDTYLLDAKEAQTIEEIATELDFPTNRVKSHILHLEKDKGVKFDIKDNKYLLQ
jgi:biotin operon repressor